MILAFSSPRLLFSSLNIFLPFPHFPPYVANCFQPPAMIYCQVHAPAFQLWAAVCTSGNLFPLSAPKRGYVFKKSVSPLDPCLEFPSYCGLWYLQGPPGPWMLFLSQEKSAMNIRAKRFHYENQALEIEFICAVFLNLCVLLLDKPVCSFVIKFWKNYHVCVKFYFLAIAIFLSFIIYCIKDKSPNTHTHTAPLLTGRESAYLSSRRRDHVLK